MRSGGTIARRNSATNAITPTKISTKLTGPSILEAQPAWGRAGSGAALTPPVATGGNAAGEPDVRSWPSRGCGGENDGTGDGAGVGVTPLEPPLPPELWPFPEPERS